MSMLETKVGDLPTYEWPVGSVVEFSIINWNERDNDKVGSIIGFNLRPQTILEWGSEEIDEPEGKAINDYPIVEQTFFGDKGITEAVNWLKVFGELEIDENDTVSEVFESSKGLIVTLFLQKYREHNGRKFPDWRKRKNVE